MNGWLWIIILSIAPISELRGAIPVAVAKFGFDIIPAYFIAVVFNILIMFVIFLFLDKLHGKFMNWKFYSKVFNRYIESKRKVFEKKASLGYWEGLILFLFVGIPLPFTGVYTGTILAWLFGVKRNKIAYPAIALGAVVAGIIVSLVTLGVLNFFH